MAFIDGLYASARFVADLEGVVERVAPARRGRRARPDAPQAHLARACPTSTRATSSGTSPWSTRTTAARWTGTGAARLLEELASGAAPRRETAKMHLIHRALELRARRPEPFAGDYRPLDAGPRAFAYARGDAVIAAMPIRLDGDASVLRVPPGPAGPWRSVLTGEDVDAPRVRAGRRPRRAPRGGAARTGLTARRGGSGYWVRTLRPAPPSRASIPPPPTSLSAPGAAEQAVRPRPAQRACRRRRRRRARPLPAPPVRGPRPRRRSGGPRRRRRRALSVAGAAADDVVPPEAGDRRRCRPAPRSRRPSAVPRRRSRPEVPTMVACRPAQTAGARRAAGAAAGPRGGGSAALQAGRRRCPAIRPAVGRVVPGHDDPAVGPEGDGEPLLERAEVDQRTPAVAEPRVERARWPGGAPRPCRPCRWARARWCRRPATLPSGWTTRPDTYSPAPKSAVVDPSPAKVGSGAPFGSSRATAKSSLARLAPATTILPSGWIATVCAKSSEPRSMHGAAGPAAERRVVVALGSSRRPTMMSKAAARAELPA